MRVGGTKNFYSSAVFNTLTFIICYSGCPHVPKPQTDQTKVHVHCIRLLVVKIYKS